MSRNHEVLPGPVYVTKWWQTQGIIRFDPSEKTSIYVADSGTRYFCYEDRSKSVHIFLGPSEYHDRLEAAQDKVKRAAARRVKKLAADVEKLQRVAQNGAEVFGYGG